MALTDLEKAIIKAKRDKAAAEDDFGNSVRDMFGLSANERQDKIIKDTEEKKNKAKKGK